MIREIVTGIEPRARFDSADIDIFEEHRGHLTDATADLKRLTAAITDAADRYHATIAVTAHSSLVYAVGTSEFEAVIRAHGATWTPEWPASPILFRLGCTVDQDDIIFTGRAPIPPRGWADVYEGAKHAAADRRRPR